MGRSEWLTGISALALTAMATAVHAQARPDFSGRWTSETAAATPARGGAVQNGRAAGVGRAGGGRSGGGRAGSGGRGAEMGSGWGSTFTITQDARSLVVEYTFFSRGDLQPPVRFVYSLDGSETKNRLMMGHGIEVSSSFASWDGNRLVITTSQTLPEPDNVTATVKRTLSLESPGVLVVETEAGGALGGPPTSSRTVYRPAAPEPAGRGGRRGGT
jgi:hypothetical protein